MQIALPNDARAAYKTKAALRACDLRHNRGRTYPKGGLRHIIDPGLRNHPF